MPNSKYSKSVIILNQVTGYLTIDIINSFSAYCTDITVLAGEIRFRRNNLESGVKVIKLIKYNSKTTLSRLGTWLLATIQAFYKILISDRRSELFLTTNPPFGIFIPLLLKRKYSILILDIYPDVLLNYGYISEKSFISRLYRKLNIRVLSKAESLFTISSGMKALVSQYVDENRIKVINCWTDCEFLKPIPREQNIFINTHGLDGKFIILYSGNLGFTHNVEIIPILAELCQRDNIIFIIVGEGDKKKFIINQIDRSTRKNIIHFPWQEIEMLPHSLSSADLAIVTIDKKASSISVPSKLFDLMAIGAPVMGIADEESELALILDKYDFGKCFPASKSDAMLAFIYKLADDKTYQQKLKNNALSASKFFGRENANKFVIK